MHRLLRRVGTMKQAHTILRYSINNDFFLKSAHFVTKKIEFITKTFTMLYLRFRNLN